MAVWRAANTRNNLGDSMRYLRYAMMLLTIALVGPSAAAVLATGVPKSQAVRVVASAPADFNVSGIEFALDKGANATPINPSTRFPFGARRVWAFWAWDNAKSGQTVKYVLRFGQTDVAWGELQTDSKDGRMEVDLQRVDGDYLMVGTFRLYLDPVGGDSGATRTAEFVIYDPDAGHDNGNNNGNGNDNGDNNNNNNSNDNGDNNNNNNSNNNDNFNFNDNNGNDNN